MRTIFFLLEKEFKQIFRNKGMLPILFVMPFVQLLVLANAATFEIQNLRLWLVDQDHSSFSRRVSGKFEASPYFRTVGNSSHIPAGEEALLTEQADLVLVIPKGFEKELSQEHNSDVQVVINAIDGMKGGLANGYAQAVLADFRKELLQENPSGSLSAVKQFSVQYANWYNEEMDYLTFMVPGILVLLVTMIGAFLSSMNIVREKEIGTIEQLNVTPIKKYQFIIGKLLPFWIIGLAMLAVGLLLAKLIYQTPMIGSLWALFGFAAVYLLVVLGFGLLISTTTDTQQQAMFISWFFLVIFILLSGLFTAVENMPPWAQVVTYLNPVRYFIEVTRMIMLKGAGFEEIRFHFTVISGFAIVFNGWAIWQYRKTV
ncbi:ABC transporter permease [Rapidithrix thailandica]|uniref:ABC transporter permease n=1 Tax=Rapidithrix thailandica TaxID=413964 RepID=A0AAW9S0C3_9BACT